MPLELYKLEPAKIDHNKLPIKAVVTRLDPRLWKEREELLASSHDFLLGDLCDTPTSNLENCFIYIAMITDNSFSSCKDDLYEEFEAAQSKALCRIFFRVSNEVKLSVSDIPTGFDWKQVMLLFRKVARWLLFWWYHRQFPEDYIRAQVSDKAYHKITQMQFVPKTREAFKKCCEDMCEPFWAMINIPYHRFWERPTLWLELRGKIAEKTGNEKLEHVWLVKQAVPSKDMPEYHPILVLLPTKNLDNKYINITQSKSKPDQETTNQLSHTPKKFVSEYVSYHVSYIEYLVYRYVEKIAETPQVLLISADAMIKSYKNRMADKRYQITGKPLLMFVCYNYLQEKTIKDLLEYDLQALKRNIPEYKIVSSDMPSDKIPEAIGRSDIVIILWGDKTQFSGNIKKEFELAESEKKPIILLDRRSDTANPLDFSLTKGCKPVQWNTAINVGKALLEVTERLLNEN